ncbi:hypothetical protein M8J76_015369 [Diaphorina citri]|nr:hypothetical protein M8J76_015369 [Diaphorina citri]
METYICNLPIIDHGNSVQVKTTWHDSNVTISILDDNAAWKGTLSYSQLSQHCHAFNISEEEHRSTCKQVLTTDQGVKEFSYHLEKNTFLWKKKILMDMKIKFGQIDIQSIPMSEVCKEIMSNLLSQNATFKTKVDTYEQEICKLKSENSELLQTLEEFTDAKIRGEQILFGKFTALLNTKKQRVACLEKLLFKNLCADPEESKAVSKREGDNNWDSDTDPEVEDGMDTSEPPAGPSGIRVSTISYDDTDEDEPVTQHEDIIPSKILKLSLSPTPEKSENSRQKSRVPEKSIPPEKSIDNVEPKAIAPTVPVNEKLEKSINEMDSQELLDLL